MTLGLQAFVTRKVASTQAKHLRSVSGTMIPTSSSTLMILNEIRPEHQRIKLPDQRYQAKNAFCLGDWGIDNLEPSTISTRKPSTTLDNQTVTVRQDEKGDIIVKYTAEEARSLKNYGELPENAWASDGRYSQQKGCPSPDPFLGHLHFTCVGLGAPMT